MLSLGIGGMLGGGALFAEGASTDPVILEVTPSDPLVNQEVCFTFFVDFPNPSEIEILFPPLPPQLVLDRIIRDVQRARPEMGFTEQRISRIRFYLFPRQVIQERVGPFMVRIQGKEYTVPPVFVSVLDTAGIPSGTQYREVTPSLSWELPSAGFRVGTATEISLVLVEKGALFREEIPHWTSQVSLHPDWIVETVSPSSGGVLSAMGGEKASIEVLRLTLIPLREGALILPDVLLRTRGGTVLKSPVQEVHVGPALLGGNRRAPTTERGASGGGSLTRNGGAVQARPASQERDGTSELVLKGKEDLVALFEGVPYFLVPILIHSLEVQFLPLWKDGQYGKALGILRRIERDSPVGVLYRGPRHILEKNIGLSPGPNEHPLFWMYSFVFLLLLIIEGWFWWNFVYRRYNAHKKPLLLGTVTFLLVILFFVIWYGGTSFLPRGIYGGRPATIVEETSVYHFPYFTKDEEKQSRIGASVKVGERVLVQVLSSPWCYVVLPYQETGWIHKKDLYFY
ncbi:MAG: hypothetical protein N2Z76_00130 [Treponemataceae bacterium]|nr:hypothetical protein [Treponemataceae bacterium]